MTTDASRAALPMHTENEHMFDDTSSVYSFTQWFDRSIRSRYVYAATRKRIEQLMPLTGTERVLEIGPGAGVWTRIIAERGCAVTAIDISKRMIEKSKAAVAPYEVEFVHSDMLSYRTETPFDRVFSARAIEYVADKVALAHHLASLVADDGELLIVSKTPTSVWRGQGLPLGYRMRVILPAVTSRFRRPRSGGRTRTSSTPPGTEVFHQRIAPWRLARLLRDAGFSDITYQPAIVGLPIIAGIEGDIPIIPRAAGPAALRAFNWLGDGLTALPQWSKPAVMWLSESYALRARKRSAV